MSGDEHGLNQNHARALFAAFGEVDRLVGEIETLAVPGHSPFAKLVDDLTPTQHAEIAAHARAIRARLVAGLAALGVRSPGAKGSARGPIETRITFAEIALQDSAAKRLRGYGTLMPEAATAVDRVLADVERSLRALRRAVRHDFGDTFDGRVDAVRDAPVDLDELKTLERVILRRGYVELRALVESLLEELENGTFEIAVFGRVSAGKSSLLNAALGTQLLPIGVTPVTAVPTRIVFGRPSETRILVEGESEERTYPANAIGSFVSERSNADNNKHVRRATLALDVPALERGIALVDTPGIGALASAGARLTLTYLPRCDLGVLVLDPGGAVGHEEVEILRMLRDSGIEARIVVTKADLVAPAERDHLAAYVRTTVLRETGLDLEPRWVSAFGEAARSWFDETIVPLSTDARARSRASCERKFARLHATIIANLRGALARESATSIADNDGLAGEAELAISRCGSRCEDIAMDARDLSVAIAKECIARILRPGPDAPSAIIRDVIVLEGENVRAKIRDELSALKTKLDAILAQMSDRTAETVSLDLTSMPSLAAPAVVSGLDSVATKRFETRGMRGRRVRDELASQLGNPLSQALSAFGRALRTWVVATCSRASEQFAAESAPLRSRSGDEGDEESVRSDLAALGVSGP